MQAERSERCEKRYPMTGLVYTYYLVYSADGYPYIVAEAEDKNGKRCEKSGCFPADGRLANAFLSLLAACEVSPYSLVEVYDEFLTLNPI